MHSVRFNTRWGFFLFNICRRAPMLPHSWMLIVFGLASCGHAGDHPSPKTAQPNATSPMKAAAKKNIIFFGNSLTAGYGLDPSEAFPSLIQQRIDSLGLPYLVVNAGVSGETSADGRSRIGWVLRQPVDVFVLELGGNDGLRELPLEQTMQNLQFIITKVKATYPAARILLTGMQIPPTMGPAYASQFRAIFPMLAAQNNIRLLPFLLEGVGGVPALNQPDGVHPTAEGDRIVAQNVWTLLKDMLK